MDFDSKRITVLKEELRRDLEALERVERLMATKNGVPASRDERQTVLPINISVADSIHVGDDDETPVTSLRGTIEATINSDPSVRWTTQRVLAHLQQAGYPLRAQKPIFSIGQALQKLVDAGRIRLVRKGAGNQPNIYKSKPAEQNAEAPSGGDQGGVKSAVVQ